MVTTAASPASLELTSDPVLQARAVGALDARAGTPWGFPSRPGHEISFNILENVKRRRHGARPGADSEAAPTLNARAGRHLAAVYVLTSVFGPL